MGAAEEVVALVVLSMRVATEEVEVVAAMVRVAAVVRVVVMVAVV